MCGIAGIFNLNGAPVSNVYLRRMTDAITHRGPDGEGFFIDSFVGLGHRRLSIIDLSPAGHQPMMTTDENYILSYNGEIYNFQELRIELESRGHRFHSRTDTEVLLYAYKEWSIEVLNRLNGMFAFVIWDRTRQELILARDRYGIKPLYYTRQNNTFLFGSEIKAILAHPDYMMELDKEALLEYFTFQNFFSDCTLFKNIKMLPAGCWMRVFLGSKCCTELHRYWDYQFDEPENPADEREYAEEMERLLHLAVNRQLVSDVEIGAYLSGGMDSGIITALAAKQLNNIKSFTCGFDLNSASGLELAFDERENAEYMSYLFKTEHYEMVLKAGDMERVMPKLRWHIEEPRIGQSYPNYYIAQLAGKFVKVVLAGTGGDEMFGGYPWRYYRAVVNADFEEYIDKYYLYWQRLIPNSVIKEMFMPIWPDVCHVWTRDIFRNVFINRSQELCRPEDYINHSLYFEAKTFLHGLLVIEDKLSMAHSLENRVPFLDNDLVDFAMHIPVRLKLGNLGEVVRLNENEPGPKTSTFYQKTRDGKLLLRQVIQRYVPEKISTGVKQGFSAPDSSWFRGESMDYVRKLLFTKNARIYAYLDPSVVKTLVTEHFEGKENRRLLIWSLLSFENFLHSFFG